MSNYKNGKIYCIRSYQTDKVYVGSTTQPLSKRLYDHKRCYKRFLNGKYGYTTSFEIVKYDDCYIELIIEISCDNVNQLRKYEGNYIRNMNCVNKMIAGRTQKEWRKDNKDKIKQYRINTKDKINEWHKTKHICNCSSSYTNRNKARHFKSKKHKRYIFELHNVLNHLMI